jgi:hypothetical protein
MKTQFRTWYKPHNGWINSMVVGEHGDIFSFSVIVDDYFSMDAVKVTKYNNV